MIEMVNEDGSLQGVTYLNYYCTQTTEFKKILFESFILKINNIKTTSTFNLKYLEKFIIGDLFKNNCKIANMIQITQILLVLLTIYQTQGFDIDNCRPPECDLSQLEKYINFQNSSNNTFVFYDSQKNDQIYPTDFISYDKEFSDEIRNAGFGFRLKTRGDEQYKVLTIEGNTEKSSTNNQKFLPLQLYSNDPNFSQGISKSHFNWRWMMMDNGNKYRAVTIEVTDINIYYNPILFRPSDLHWWAGETQKDVAKSSKSFNWRNIQRDQDTFKLITLE